MLLPPLAGLLLAALLMGDPFTYEYSGSTDAKGTAFVVIQANEDVSDLEIVIGGDGQTIRKTTSLKKGSKQKVSWKQSSAQARYEMQIKGTGVEADFAFEIVRTKAQGKVGKLKVMSSREDIVKRHTATYETSFPLSSYEYKIYDSDADIVAAKTVAPANVPAGGTFTISWDSPAEIFMIDVRGEDEFGRFTEYKLVPWAVEIPHTEINFDSGKSDIKPGEVPKLDEALAVAFHELEALDKVNKAVNASLTPQLYIVGYTDTVGPGGSNDKLSDGRAKAIAKYFYDQGFWAEIYFAGMGERALRVETGDNVDEVRNRRALYLIGVQQPPAGGQVPGRWKKLAGARSKPAGFTMPALPPKWADFREKRRAGVGAEDHAGTSATDEGGGDAAEGPAPAFDPDASRGEEPESGVDYGGGGDDGPPAVEGEPGATKKGCSVGGDAPGVALGAFVLLALGWRRRSAA